MAQQPPPIQIHLDHWQNGCTPSGNSPKASCPDQTTGWIDGNLHKTNSTYGEGDFIPTRFVLDHLTPGQVYSLRFQWLAAKAQGGGDNRLKHAHDYLSTYNKFAAASYRAAGAAGPDLDPCLPRVQGGGKGPDACSGDPNTATIPADLFGLNAANAQPWHWSGPAGTPPGAEGPPALFSLWNGEIQGVTGYTYSTSNTTGQLTTNTTYNEIEIQFMASNSIPEGEGVVLALGARLAWDGEWNPGNGKAGIKDDGACSISGAPYHWAYELNLLQEGAPSLKLQSGNRDRSIMCTSSQVKTTLTLLKSCFAGTEPTTVDAFGNEAIFNFEGAPSPDAFDPAQFVVSCAQPEGSTFTFNTQGTFSLTELADQNSFGWELRNIRCVHTGTETNANATYTGATDSPTDGFELGDRTANVTLRNGNDVTCTFSNHLAEMPLLKRISTDQRVPKCTVPGTEPPRLADDVLGADPALTTPCYDDVVGELPQFQLNLYPTITGTETSLDDQPFGFPSQAGDPGNGIPPTPLGTLYVPPVADPAALIGVPLTVCEMNIPTGWYLPDSGIHVTVTFADNSADTLSPTVYTPSVEAGNTQGDRNRCWNVIIPFGTVEYQQVINNFPRGTIVVTKESQGGYGTFTFGTEGGLADCGGVLHGNPPTPSPALCTGIPGTFDLTTSETTNPDSKTFTVDALVNCGGNGQLTCYGVNETDAPDPGLVAWETTVSCSNEVDNNEFGVAPGATVQCDFVNKKRPKLTLVKHLIPVSDKGTFNLIINGTTYATGGDGTSTGSQYANFGNNTVEETGAGETLLSNYSSRISCVDNNTAGSFPITPNATGTGGSLTLAEGDDVTCTIDNVLNACTVTQGGWHAPPAGNNWGMLLANNFDAQYPTGFVVGGTNTLTFTKASEIAALNPAGGSPGPLNGSYTDIFSTQGWTNYANTGSGEFGSQVVALQLNVDFSAAGLFPLNTSFGDFVISGSGQTVSQFLADANAALGDPNADVTYWNSLIGHLNEAFDNCSTSDWVFDNLE